LEASPVKGATLTEDACDPQVPLAEALVPAGATAEDAGHPPATADPVATGATALLFELPLAPKIPELEATGATALLLLPHGPDGAPGAVTMLVPAPAVTVEPGIIDGRLLPTPGLPVVTGTTITLSVKVAVISGTVSVITVADGPQTPAGQVTAVVVKPNGQPLGWVG